MPFRYRPGVSNGGVREIWQPRTGHTAPYPEEIQQGAGSRSNRLFPQVQAPQSSVLQSRGRVLTDEQAAGLNAGPVWPRGIQ